MVNVKKRAFISILLVLVIIGAAGCNADYKQLLQKAHNEEPLIKVMIQFTDQKQTVCYVKSLGMEEKAQIYTGGASLNYMYDSNGNIIGSYNYQRVVFMKILTDEENGD